jgi:hypothetical protein
MPNGIVLCVDQTDRRGPAGRFYHFYSETATKFQSMDELMFEMETFFDKMNFPYPATGRRVFAGWAGKGNRACGRLTEQTCGEIRDGSQNQERVKVMNEEELLRRHGNLGTFIVRVQQRQNSSWQGRITWSDKNETVNFRSAWEMVRLIAEALDRTEQTEEVGWPEENADERK